MLAAEAHVQTQHPSRYLAQLCRHAQQVHRLRHGPRAHDGGDGQQTLKVQHVEWSETRGMISFGWGQCTMQAAPGTLTLHAEAVAEENLQRVQDIVARDIERFGRRDHLKVSWQRSEASTAEPGPTQPGEQPCP
jgi:hypothetical protein